MEQIRGIKVIGSDAGGTMTDMFLIDQIGEFVVGKATTHKEESTSFWNALIDASGHWGIDWDKEAPAFLPLAEACAYSGTTMLNVLVTRTGRKLGLICTRGHESTLLHERAKSVCAGYVHQDRLHQVAHIHNEPLVPRRLIKGVTERIDSFGEVTIPLYEHEVREAMEHLLARDVDGIVVWLLFSYLNPMHEMRVAEIGQEVMEEKGIKVPLYLSSQICPIWREVSRLNSTLLHAYAADPVRKQLFGIEAKLRGNGYKYPLQIVLSSGGLANIRYPRLHEATFSGPIGGLLGGQYVGKVLGIGNLVCTDVGGTTLDVGLLMGGEPVILREVEMAHMIFNIPTVVMDSIGAGTGMYLRLAPETGRLEMGPGSAGADPGPVCYKMGNEVPTVMDCCLILGILNPDYHLGGRLKLDQALAYEAIKRRCADPLGVDPYDFAEGVIDLVNARMREHIRRSIEVRGFAVADYHLIGYGGAGPMFLAGYTDGLPLRGAFTVPFASCFSAFGCTTTDYVHRYQKSTFLIIPWGADEATKMQMGYVLNMGWEELEGKALSEMEEEGIPREKVKLEQIAYVRYAGQLEDLEVESPVSRITNGEDMDQLLAAFEEKYARVYFRVARYPEAGYQIMELGIRASAEKPKPVIRNYSLDGKEPSKEANKGEREVYLKRRWQKAKLCEMDLLNPGNEVEGLAVIEAPTTSLFVPPGKKIRIDEYKVMWLEETR